MALRDRTLYVADVDELIEINVASGEIINRHEAKGAIFLNDVAVGDDGTVYASDTPMNTIWRLKDGTFEPWLADDDLNGPNGLWCRATSLSSPRSASCRARVRNRSSPGCSPSTSKTNR